MADQVYEHQHWEIGSLVSSCAVTRGSWRARMTVTQFSWLSEVQPYHIMPRPLYRHVDEWISARPRYARRLPADDGEVKMTWHIRITSLNH